MPPTSLKRESTAWQTKRLLNAPRDNRIASLLLLIAMLAVWSWWALADGAFFGTVFFPGAVLLYAVLALTIGLARFPISMRGPHAVALLAFAALGAWTALSLLWTPARDLAFDYAQRTFFYAAAFALGLVLAVNLRRRMILAVVPFLGAGAIVAVVLLVKLWTATDVDALIGEGDTLDLPFGYRNANAGFFAMVALGAVALAGSRSGGFALRPPLALLGATTASLAVISQSRGSLAAILIGVAVLVAVSPRRGRTMITLFTVAIPVALVFSQLLDPFEAATGRGDVLSELGQAGLYALVAGVLAGVLAAAAEAAERRGVDTGLPRMGRRASWLATGAVALVAVAAVVLVAGSPLGPLRDTVDAISNGDTDYEEIEGSRFTYGGGLNRIDFWRVALGQAGDAPLIGGGAGSFRSSYLLDRDSSEEPRNAHGIPIETLGELGIVGLALLLAGFGAAGVAALRSRRLGPESAALSAVALTVGAVWMTQAFVDWSWSFAGLTAPVLGLLGAAAAPSALSFDLLSARARIAVSALALPLALVAIPSFVSERLTLRAAQDWRTDVDGAYGALETAADVNPFANVPLLVEAEIARLNGDDARALQALDGAGGRSPDDWRSYSIRARVLAETSPGEAIEQVDLALTLNPDSEELPKLRSRLEAQLESRSGP